MKNNSLTIAFGALALVTTQICIAMFFEVSSLKRELRITEKSKELAEDQIDELMYVVGTLRNEKDVVSTKQFVAGVLEAIDKKEYLSSVWHEGYDRGSNVVTYTRLEEKENSK